MNEGLFDSMEEPLERQGSPQRKGSVASFGLCCSGFPKCGALLLFSSSYRHFYPIGIQPENAFQ